MVAASSDLGLASSYDEVLTAELSADRTGESETQGSVAMTFSKATALVLTDFVSNYSPVSSNSVSRLLYWPDYQLKRLRLIDATNALHGLEITNAVVDVITGVVGRTVVELEQGDVVVVSTG